MIYTLSSIVEELLVEMGEGQSNKFARFYQFGLSFLRQKHFTTTGFPKVVQLTINENNDTADLPNDYVQYIKIGLCINGQIYSLGLDNSICLNPSFDQCGNPVRENYQSLGYNGWGYIGDRVGDHYRNGEMMGRFFGIGADNNALGYYRINKETNQIQFSQLTCTANVVLEYLSDVNSLDGDFEVHPFSVEALKNYMFYMYKFRSSKSLGEIELANDLYKKSFLLMQRMFATSTLDEWIAAFQSGNMSAPKM